jgi:hypothetical protein
VPESNLTSGKPKTREAFSGSDQRTAQRQRRNVAVRPLVAVKTVKENTTMTATDTSL